MHFGALDYIGIKTKNPVNDVFTGFRICLYLTSAEKEGFEPRHILCNKSMLCGL